ncbi:ImmA/IrrE family metallo-endopeptidase [Mucilaginibacter sp. ZT4R22]|uniref:ImmA/IrrE family metallo-endopeptidase n=1 Tax=Mucilaginibacter pankratovii TaxID=2772110 RepID=A0ABR7WIQ6_9SPHI|nr:ImmA/IrrE family metallo-endopeptidase [Mucilaginibacter pankratovii]MBD1362216.1 ImmA/IrrE family metallo-endopeptidase [Mucilaginibacter pankratovii]
MGLVLSPEVKMARRIIKKHSLSVPFDLEELVKQYAKITYISIPVEGVDGICLYLKTPNKTPSVIVNVNSTTRRQKFTLAHELGHIVIPWHLGNFVDDIDENPNQLDNQYWELEREANRFASELLMPFDWIYSLYKKNSDCNYLISQICERCGVSDIAASIRLSTAIFEIESILMPKDWVQELFTENSNLAVLQKIIVEKTKLDPVKVASYMTLNLPGSISFCVEDEGTVIRSGSTHDAHSYHQFDGHEFLKDPYPYYSNYYLYTLNNINTHWWVLHTNFVVPFDNRDWRSILEKISIEISPSQGVKSFKDTVNGKLSGVNGNYRKKNSEPNIEEFMKDVIQRFNNPEFKDFITHKDFLPFIRKRSEDFFKSLISISTQQTASP